MEPRTRADYFDAALDLLADGGVPAVTIARLCDRLGVTKGSFYHHFPSQPAFLDAFLHHWEVERFEQLATQVDAEQDPLRRIELLKRLGVDTHHEAEAAIRAWAQANPVVAAVQERVDRAREEQLMAAFVAAGIEPDQADVLARIGLRIMVGTQQMSARVDRAELAALFDEYERWLVASARLPEPT